MNPVGVSSLQGGAVSGALVGLFHGLGVGPAKRKDSFSEILRDELDGADCKAKVFYKLYYNV